ncbi:transglycosylase SLT domain-containing protein [Streptomyces sp. NPDC002537]
MRSTISGYTRLPKAHKISAAGIAAAGAAILACAAVPNAFAASDTQPVAVKTVAWNTTASDDSGQAQQAQQAAVTQAHADAAKTKGDRAAQQAAASRSEDRKPVETRKAYANNLDGWITEALDIMHAKGIPGSYEGLKRNIMRESTGNPQAINNWDSNAVAGIPSKGLLQIIDPTFKAFHVDGTSWDIYDPVANIVASCNYAAKTYGSMDNVNSAY